MIIPFPIAQFLLDHIGADGVEPLGLPCDLRGSDMGLINQDSNGQEFNKEGSG
jgi:hypothetical protein